ncbi:MAG TPA: ABC transporter permease [bacterium]|nr:ABC transporter permease [bacterium]
MTYVVHRIAHSALVVAGVLVLVSLLIHLVPGDPAQLMVGDAPVSAAQLQQIRKSLGLDRPLPAQLAGDAVRFARGDLGRSLRSGRPISDTLRFALPSTLSLAVAAMAFAVLVGVPAGILASVYRGRWVDTAATAFAVVGISLPSFWTGILFIVLFAVQLGWFPTSGQGSLRALVLPALTLGWYPAGALARVLRSSMLEVMRREYVGVARAKGVRERAVVLHHALRNALLPTVTLGTIQFGALLSGAIVTETVFARDGLGRLVVEGILQKDFPVVQGVVLVIAVIYTLMNLSTDLMYAWLDPRIRYG